MPRGVALASPRCGVGREEDSVLYGAALSKVTG